MGYIGFTYVLPFSEAWKQLCALLASASKFTELNYSQTNFFLIAFFSKWKINDFDDLLACYGFVFILIGISDISF